MADELKKINGVVKLFGRGVAQAFERKGTRIERRVEDIVSISDEAREKFASSERDDPPQEQEKKEATGR